MNSPLLVLNHSRIDDQFLSIPFDLIADTAITTATKAGATWADVRIESGRDGGVALHDCELETAWDYPSIALGVRVIVDGAWGFASDPVISEVGARRAAIKAVKIAKLSRALTNRKVELADAPVIGRAQWSSSWVVDPFTVSEREKIDLFAQWSDGLMREGADHVDATCNYILENKFYGDVTGNHIIQQRMRIESELTATIISDDGKFTSLSTLAAPTARGYEWMTDGSHDWEKELAELPSILKEKAKAPGVKPGKYDIVIDPTNLWLTIHESIGHATELDRILGYETNYAGTTFVTLNDINTLKYGSGLLNITGDRSTPYGLSTIGFDDEGVMPESFSLISNGVLANVQSDRSSAAAAGFPYSNGCAYAEGADSVPLQRMPNISMQHNENGPDLQALIGGVENGLYIKGDDSWSIDMQRKNFQFTGQQFWRIEQGKITNQVNDAAYQSTTPEFWGSLTEVGNQSTYKLNGALNCGKGQPGQGAPVSHGAPAARFNQINIINTAEDQK